MANYLKNIDVSPTKEWGPIAFNGEKDFTGRELTMVFDASTTSGTHYTGLFKVPISAETELVWNPDAVTLETGCDVTISWQGTDDPAVAHKEADTGWTTVAVHTMTSDDTSSAKTQATFASAAGVVQKPYMRLKIVHATAAGADSGTDEVKLRIVGIPPLGGAHVTLGGAL